MDQLFGVILAGVYSREAEQSWLLSDLQILVMR